MRKLHHNSKLVLQMMMYAHLWGREQAIHHLLNKSLRSLPWQQTTILRTRNQISFFVSSPSCTTVKEEESWSSVSYCRFHATQVPTRERERHTHTHVHTYKNTDKETETISRRSMKTLLLADWFPQLLLRPKDSFFPSSKALTTGSKEEREERERTEPTTMAKQNTRIEKKKQIPG
jgi:hypothetical protein